MRMGQNKTLEEIIDRLANCEPGSVAHGQMMAEITLKQIQMQSEALEAQKAAAEAEAKAADAAAVTAKATQRNAMWMLLSAIAAGASAVITAISVAFNVFSH